MGGDADGKGWDRRTVCFSVKWIVVGGEGRKAEGPTKGPD